MDLDKLRLLHRRSKDGATVEPALATRDEPEAADPKLLESTMNRNQKAYHDRLVAFQQLVLRGVEDLAPDADRRLSRRLKHVERATKSLLAERPRA